MNLFAGNGMVKIGVEYIHPPLSIRNYRLGIITYMQPEIQRFPDSGTYSPSRRENLCLTDRRLLGSCIQN